MKTRYRYLGCIDRIMHWETTTPIPGDSRGEHVKASWDWFWGAR